MDITLEEEYFRWLYRLIDDTESADISETHWSLALQLHKREFVWIVSNDDNRVEDGRELRYEFSHETHQDLTPEWHSFGVSMLEMLVALAKRFAFQTDGDLKECFWQLMWNVDLDKYTDRKYNSKAERAIDVVVDRIIWRTYSYGGDGGLFPLESPDRDQRKVELWYQMSAYVISHL